jgi:hypothetical protein
MQYVVVVLVVLGFILFCVLKLAWIGLKDMFRRRP